MKVLALALTLLLTSQAFAISRSSSKNRNEKNENTGKIHAETSKSLNSLQSKMENLNLEVKLDISKITKDMQPTEANQLKIKAKELESALEKKKEQLANNSKVRGEVEVVLQIIADALATRSQYESAKKEAQGENAKNVKDTVDILDNALTIAKAKVLDAENVSKSEMVTLFRTIAAIQGAKAGDVIKQAGRVADAIQKMAKVPFDIISCK